MLYDIKSTNGLFYILTAYFFFGFPIFGSIYFYLKLECNIDEKKKRKVFLIGVLVYSILFLVGAVSRI